MPRKILPRIAAVAARALEMGFDKIIIVGEIGGARETPL